VLFDVGAGIGCPAEIAESAGTQRCESRTFLGLDGIRHGHSSMVRTQNMAHLTPGEAIEATETALRQLLQHVVPGVVGENWLEQQVTPEKLTQWTERRAEEQKKRETRGIAKTPDSLLAYADLFSLRKLAEKNWSILDPSLGKKSETGALLKRLDDLRNTVQHNRPLVPFEEDLVAGIAGEIRNRVTIFMSTQDEAGEFYPRIEFAQDNFGNSVDIFVDPGGMGGLVQTGLTVYEGDVLTFTLRGSDPQNRELWWWRNTLVGVEGVRSASDGTAELRVELTGAHVRELLEIGISVRAEGTPYHRTPHDDHRVFFIYRCRPRPVI
jgi:hypothetical protein